MRIHWDVCSLGTLLGRTKQYLHAKTYGPCTIHAIVEVTGASPDYLAELIEELNISINAQLLAFRQLQERFL